MAGHSIHHPKAHVQIDVWQNGGHLDSGKKRTNQP
jgi:hypothetical protein